MDNSAVAEIPTCVICHQPCPLETCKVHQDGKAAHEGCLVARTLGVPLQED
jgi:hypothetical protein